MRQRGRKSAEAAITHVGSRPPLLEPPEAAPGDVQAVFRAIVSTVPPEHFRPSDALLVEQYAQAVALARVAYDELRLTGPVVDGKTSPWVAVLEKAHRSSVALAARLRLAPQQRTDPKTTGRMQQPVSPPPWGFNG
jgi:phage terminase small subunit